MNRNVSINTYSRNRSNGSAAAAASACAALDFIELTVAV
jgi:hypothetical protein